MLQKNPPPGIESDFKKVESFFAVKFDEAILFIMSFNIIVLILIDIYFINDGFTSDFLYLITKTKNGKIFLVILAMLFGMLISIYHAFSSKKKSSRTKKRMLYFGIMINLFSAISAGIHQFKYGFNLFSIFPAWNMFSAFAIFFIHQNNPSRVSDRNAKLKELIIGSILSMLIIFISTYFFKNNWAITFSMANAYASSLYRPTLLAFKKIKSIFYS